MGWNNDHLEAVECLLFRSDLVKVGRFECAGSHPAFRHTELDNDVFAFVRSPVWLRRGAGNFHFIEPGGVVLHRAGTELERRRNNGHGEHAYWFGVHPGTFLEALQRHHLPTEDMGSALVSDPRLRFHLNLLVNRLENEDLDALAVEETVLNLFDEICARRANRVRENRAGRLGTAARRRQLADKARAYLDEHLVETVSLEAVARSVGASLFHLCRIFRDETGLTLHAYRTRQRLGRAVERMLGDDQVNLSEVAFELGFSSHSHLSRVFHRQVGVPPSALRGKMGTAAIASI